MDQYNSITMFCILQIFWTEEHEGGHELPPGGKNPLLSGRLQGRPTEREGGLCHLQTDCKSIKILIYQ